MDSLDDRSQTTLLDCHFWSGGESVSDQCITHAFASLAHWPRFGSASPPGLMLTIIAVSAGDSELMS